MMFSMPSSDRLNPLIVKELRQELRMKSFLNLFTWSQLILGMVTLLSLSIGESHEGGSTLSFFFWLTLTVPLFLLLPRRSAASFSKETDAHTLELLLLTNLSPWQITLGKWSALALQVGLYIIAAGPYLLLSYFTGGDNPLQNLEIAFLMVVGSLTLLASGIASSAASGGKRGFPFIIFLIVAGLFILYASSLLSRYSYSPYASTSSSTFLFSFEDYLAAGPLFPIGLLLILDTAVSRISPTFEYAVLPRRFLLVVLTGWCGVVTALNLSNPALITLTAYLFVAVSLLSSLFEPLDPRLSRSSSLRTLAKTLLTKQGWPGSIFLASAVLSVLTILLLSETTANNWELPFLLLGQTLTGILLPLLVVIIVFPPERRGFKQYFGTHMLLLLSSVLILLPLTAGVDLRFLICFIPHGLLGGLGQTNSITWPTISSCLAAILSLLALAVHAASLVTQGRKT